jgi:hypothetical protein
MARRRIPARPVVRGESFQRRHDRIRARLIFHPHPAVQNRWLAYLDVAQQGVGLEAAVERVGQQHGISAPGRPGERDPVRCVTRARERMRAMRTISPRVLISSTFSVPVCVGFRVKRSPCLRRAVRGRRAASTWPGDLSLTRLARPLAAVSLSGVTKMSPPVAGSRPPTR